eukprot:CAMPEP_0119130400 /NCGR_PEP_ID=MMETSP1310-20130426/7759_1 /TAXON_ID=464262 /ORGANISM="Genus nov. species nov., Strain RCC2339" /LENGTH=239 /DNA_ID=CAMNT_0007120905 /DNA_START=92 /DNA_END=811 /DNA_ORIENTATION=+
MDRRVKVEKEDDSMAPQLPVTERKYLMIQYLNSRRHRPVSQKEVKDELGFDPWEDDLYAALRRRVRYNDEKRYLEYKSKYSAQSFDALKDLIFRHRTGILQSDLYDTYPDAERDLGVLYKEKKVYRIFNKDEKDFMYYPNNADDETLRMEKNITPQIQSSWATIALPNVVEMEELMRKRGLSVTEKTERNALRKVTGPPQKRKRRTLSKKKITNNHLNDTALDVTKAYEVHIDQLPDRN